MPKWFLLAAILILASVGVYSQYKRLGNPIPAFAPVLSLNSNKPKIGGAEVGGYSLPVGLGLAPFATGLDGVRDLEWVDPVLVASLTGKGQVVALPDTNGDGLADPRVLLTGLGRPHGLTYRNGFLYVAEEGALSRFRFNPQTLEISLDRKLFDLPKGGRHFTRSLDFDNRGRLFITLGSSCDVCEEKGPWVTKTLVTDADGNKPVIFDQGLRNAVFIKHNPITDQMWVTEMGRDFLGDNLPPDEINVLTEGANYGWPYCFGNKVWDAKFGRKDQAYCNGTTAPKFELPAHVAPLGLNFINSPLFPADWQGDLLVALHGSWNSTVPVGYKVVRLDISGNEVVGMSDVLTGFIRDGAAAHRPVDLEFGSKGELYVSDDKGGEVFVMR